jgi:hypothetical protein
MHFFPKHLAWTHLSLASSPPFPFFHRSSSPSFFSQVSLGTSFLARTPASSSSLLLIEPAGARAFLFSFKNLFFLKLI